MVDEKTNKDENGFSIYPKYLWLQDKKGRDVTKVLDENKNHVIAKSEEEEEELMKKYGKVSEKEAAKAPAPTWPKA